VAAVVSSARHPPQRMPVEARHRQRGPTSRSEPASALPLARKPDKLDKPAVRKRQRRSTKGRGANKTPFFLDEASKGHLLSWSLCHLDSPYPNAREKAMLAKDANLKNKQIEDFFRNYRRRHWHADLRRREDEHGIPLPDVYWEYKGKANCDEEGDPSPAA